MYQALYRKYRPATLDEVVGQEAIIHTLKHAIINNKVTHAYLFTGPRGTGKTSIAKILAKTINCEHLENISPCDSCVSCTQINDHKNTDIMEIDAASNNGVDEIRELRSKISLVPSNGKYKVYIVDEVHMLTQGAFNALLKTLEEPPAHIVFILATTEPHKIPMTILSRCQRFDFKRIAIDKIVSRLRYIADQENIRIQDAALTEIARLSDGGMRDSISMLDQVISYSDSEITVDDVHDVNGTISQSKLKEFINSLLNNQIDQMFMLIDQYNNMGKNLIKLTEEIILFLRNILLCQTVPKYFNDNYISTELYSEFSTQIESSTLIDYIKKLNLLILEMKQSNNPKINLEIAFIQLSKPQILESKEPSNYFPENNLVEPKVKEKQDESIGGEKRKKEEPKHMDDISVDPILQDRLLTIKKIRIDNTLSKFHKRKTLELKQRMEEIRSMILIPEYSKGVSMLLDGELKALGENQYAIFIYDNRRMADLFNENIVILERILQEAFQMEYHVIAMDSSEWNILKQEFNGKTRPFVETKETIDIKDLLNKDSDVPKDSIENMFEDIIEYS